jgi:hypothetical protein
MEVKGQCDIFKAKSAASGLCGRSLQAVSVSDHHTPSCGKSVSVLGPSNFQLPWTAINKPCDATGQSQALRKTCSDALHTARRVMTLKS